MPVFMRTVQGWGHQPEAELPQHHSQAKSQKGGSSHPFSCLFGGPSDLSLSSWRLPCAVSSVEAALMTVALHSPGCGRNLHRQRYNREAVYKMGSHGPTRAGSGRLPPHLKLCDVVLTSDSRNGCCVTFWVRRPIRMYVDGMRAWGYLVTVAGDSQCTSVAFA